MENEKTKKKKEAKPQNVEDQIDIIDEEMLKAGKYTEDEEMKQAVNAIKEKRKIINVPEGWVPKTILGKKVYSGEITNIKKVFEDGMKISEPEIIDVLLPDLENEIILIGGTTGKGGGIKRTPFRRTTRMHRSGRRYKISVMSIVGNKNGYVGLGLAAGPMGKNREVIQKAINRAKLNMIPVLRGCGSWECLCGGHHSIPASVDGKSGSVKIRLISAPKGVGLVVADEIKKILKLAGIEDIWSNTRGNTHMRINFIKSAFNALRKLNTYKLKPEFEAKVGMKVGRVD